MRKILFFTLCVFLFSCEKETTGIDDNSSVNGGSATTYKYYVVNKSETYHLFVKTLAEHIEPTKKSMEVEVGHAVIDIEYEFYLKSNDDEWGKNLKTKKVELDKDIVNIIMID